MMKKLLLGIAISAVVFPAHSVSGFREMQNNIGISAVECAADELLVDASGWKLKTSDFIKKGFKPVRVQIVNNSDQVVSISDTSVHFANFDTYRLTDQFKCRENVRPLLYFVCTQALCWTIMIASVFGMGSGAVFMGGRYNAPGTAAFVGSLITGLFSAVASFGFFVRTPFYWMNLREANRKLHSIMMDALHAGHIIIPPHQNAEKIILVPVGFARVFSFEVMNEGTGNTAAKFYVDVRK